MSIANMGHHAIAPAPLTRPGARHQEESLMQDDPNAIPYGYCHCGCGQKTIPWEVSNRPRGRIRGEPRRFIHGHNTLVANPNPAKPLPPPEPCQCGCGRHAQPGRRFIKGHHGRKPFDPDVVGYCECGCGERTVVSPKTDTANGHVLGQPRRFKLGHSASRTPVSPVEYLEDPDTGCWVWQRAMTRGGYGFRQGPAHRYVYERERGPIPDDLTLDHLCRNPGCVNPDHLEPVTSAENTRRGRGAKLGYHGAFSARMMRASTTLSYAEIADVLGVTHATAQDAAKGKSWQADV